MSLQLCSVCGLLLGSLESDVHESCRAIEAPNLDCMDRDELATFINESSNMGFPGAIRDKLVTYAVKKSTAISYRLSGRIFDARDYERACERIYDLLPAAYRW